MNVPPRFSIIAQAFCLLALSLWLASCADTTLSTGDSGGPEVRAGGSTTVFDASGDAFSHPAPNLTGESARLHQEGDDAFDAEFVVANGTQFSGLGPLYNNTSCSGCHPKDGRGEPPLPGGELSSMLFRVSVPGEGPHGGPMPAPGFGGQFQDHALPGVPAEGTIATSYREVAGTFADGSTYSLRHPVYSIVASYQPVPSGMLLSPRVGPPVFGLGLLEAVPESSILALADENDRDGDGISGRPNRVWDPVAGSMSIGRFGWKAGAPNLYAQTAGAYNEDMGITSSLLKIESCHGQSQYVENNAAADINDETMDVTALYVRTLGVPARRNAADPRVVAGAGIFRAANCSGCHIPSMTTGPALLPELASQTIYPYTDLLLHDMGDDLGDGRPDFLATGNEWRTPPLWGIGLTQAVNGHTYFLHDGRARNLLEAIMWHGGEAARSREYVRQLNRSDREALLAFLGSL